MVSGSILFLNGWNLDLLGPYTVLGWFVTFQGCRNPLKTARKPYLKKTYEKAFDFQQIIEKPQKCELLFWRRKGSRIHFFLAWKPSGSFLVPRSFQDVIWVSKWRENGPPGPQNDQQIFKKGRWVPDLMLFIGKVWILQEWIVFVGPPGFAKRIEYIYIYIYIYIYKYILSVNTSQVPAYYHELLYILRKMRGMQWPHIANPMPIW